MMIQNGARGDAMLSESRKSPLGWIPSKSRSFAEFILSELPRSFAPLRMTSEGLRMTGRRARGRSARRARGDRGAAQIEFALTILTIVFVMFWMWELVMMTYTMNVLSDSAKEGVR